MKKFYNFLALLFQMASKLPRPQLRGLFGDYIRKRMAAIFSVSLVSTLPVYYYGVNQIKHKHLDFFSRTDPYVLQEQLIKDGAYYIVTPEGTVTWDEE